MRKILLLLLCATVLFLPACVSEQKVDYNDWRYQAGYEDGKRDGYGEAESRYFESRYDDGYQNGWDDASKRAKIYLSDIDSIIDASELMTKDEVINEIMKQFVMPI